MAKKVRKNTSKQLDIKLDADAHLTETEIQALLDEERRTINYGVNDYTAEILSSKLTDGALEEGDIFVPEYQRKLVWSASEKSYFVESLLIRIPIPPLFLYDVDGRLEVVDGSQRLRSIKQFFENKFALVDLEKLDFLNGFTFADLPPVTQRRLKNQTIRTFVLSENADNATRFDLFRRINTSGRRLTAAELRKGLFPGPFLDLIVDCAASTQFVALCPIGGRGDKASERQELALRFFAYSDRYIDFRHDVERFLNSYLLQANGMTAAEIQTRRENFESMVEFAQAHLPNGFAKAERSKSTPRVRFEALSVGIHLALREGLNAPPAFDWLESEKFKKHTRTDASNSGPKLRGRIEYVRDNLLGRP